MVEMGNWGTGLPFQAPEEAEGGKFRKYHECAQRLNGCRVCYMTICNIPAHWVVWLGTALWAGHTDLKDMQLHTGNLEKSKLIFGSGCIQ